MRGGGRRREKKITDRQGVETGEKKNKTVLTHPGFTLALNQKSPTTTLLLFLFPPSFFSSLPSVLFPVYLHTQTCTNHIHLVLSQIIIHLFNSFSCYCFLGFSWVFNVDHLPCTQFVLITYLTLNKEERGTSL